MRVSRREKKKLLLENVLGSRSRSGVQEGGSRAESKSPVQEVMRSNLGSCLGSIFSNLFEYWLDIAGTLNAELFHLFKNMCARIIYFPLLSA